MKRPLEKGRLCGAWPPLRRTSSWPAALLAAASILSSCFLLTEGQDTVPQIKILLQPPHPAEGQNVTLTPTPEDLMEKAVFCRWYRGLTTVQDKLIFSYQYFLKPEQTDGTASTGRETGGPGCSLHITSLTSEDTGNYTVAVVIPGRILDRHASVVVSGLPNPDLVPSNGSIIVGSLAVSALVVGTLLYFFLRARGQRNKASTQTTAAPSVYENVSPSRQVKIDGSAVSSNIYQTLQHPDQSVYQQLEGSRQVNQPVSLS